MVVLAAADQDLEPLPVFCGGDGRSRLLAECAALLAENGPLRGETDRLRVRVHELEPKGRGAAACGEASGAAALARGSAGTCRGGPGEGRRSYGTKARRPVPEAIDEAVRVLVSGSAAPAAFDSPRDKDLHRPLSLLRVPPPGSSSLLPDL